MDQVHTKYVILGTDIWSMWLTNIGHKDQLHKFIVQNEVLTQHFTVKGPN